MPLDSSKKYTGKNDKNGKPIYDGDTLLYNGMEFLVVEFLEYATDEDGVIMGYFIPNDCEVIAESSKLNKQIEKN